MPSYPALYYKPLEINYLTFTLSERQDCKFIISNIYSDSVENVSANFRYERSSRIGWVEIEGNIKLDEPYYIEDNGSKKMIYLSKKKKETYSWIHTENITVYDGKKARRAISIDLTHYEQFYYFLIKSMKEENRYGRFLIAGYFVFITDYGRPERK